MTSDRFRRIFSRAHLCVASLALCALIAGGAQHPASAGHSVYFAHITGHLSLKSGQRRAVNKIMNKSEREVLAAFRKFDIDPRAKPDFNKLMQARHVLQSIERSEREQLKQILSREQMKIYDKIIAQTHARVIKGTRNDN